jgi:hypothetical protein
MQALEDYIYIYKKTKQETCNCNEHNNELSQQIHYKQNQFCLYLFFYLFVKSIP